MRPYPTPPPPPYATPDDITTIRLPVILANTLELPRINTGRKPHRRTPVIKTKRAREADRRLKILKEQRALYRKCYTELSQVSYTALRQPPIDPALSGQDDTHEQRYADLLEALRNATRKIDGYFNAYKETP